MSATFNYPRSAATADRLIKKFGTTGAIRRFTMTGPPQDPTRVATNYPCSLVKLDYKDSDIDGTLILTTDVNFYVSTKGLAIEPATSDKVIFGGKEFEVITVSPLNPSGVMVFYDIQARA